MGHGTMTPETRYGTARRLLREMEEEYAEYRAGAKVIAESLTTRLREAEAARAEAEVRERLTLARLRAAEGSRDSLRETVTELARDALAAPFLAEMVLEFHRTIEALTGPEDPCLGVAAPSEEPPVLDPPA